MDEDTFAVAAILVFLAVVISVLAWAIRAPGRRRALERERLYDLLSGVLQAGAELPPDLLAALLAQSKPDPDKDGRTAAILAGLAIGLVLLGAAAALAGLGAGWAWAQPLGLLIGGLAFLPASIAVALIVFDRSRPGSDS